MTRGEAVDELRLLRGRVREALRPLEALSAQPLCAAQGDALAEAIALLRGGLPETRPRRDAPPPVAHNKHLSDCGSEP